MTSRMRGGEISAFVILGLALCLTGLSNAQVTRVSAKDVKDSLMSRIYDRTVIPVGVNGTGPVHVNVSLIVKNFVAVDHRTMTLQGKLRISWIDTRMKYESLPPKIAPDNITLDASLLEEVWIPKLYFGNSLKQEIDKENQYILLHLADGKLDYSGLITLTTQYPMDLHYFPHDSNTCITKISSYGNTANEIVFNAGKGSASVQSTPLTGYQLRDIRLGKCDFTTPTGVYSCLQLEIELKRESSWYLVQVYIPCCMLVILSWISYFLDPVKAAVPRIIIAISALALAVIGISGFNLSAAPQVSYTKAIDVWTGITLTFIFTSVIEFVVVNYMNHCGCGSNGARNRTPGGGSATENAEQQTPLNPDAEGRTEKSGSDGAEETGFPHVADVVLRIAIPIFWILFALLYWIIYV